MNAELPLSSARAPHRMIIGPVPVDAVTCAEALDVVGDLLLRGEGGAVFTPNVDHIMIADENPRMRAAYRRASLSLADGMPVLWAARLLGDPLPEKVSGSDFVPALLERAAERGWRVYFVGGAPGVAEAARDSLRETLPRLEVVGIDVPVIDVNDAPTKWSPIVERIRASRSDIVLVAFGAPKQEIFIQAVRDELRPAIFFGIGASLDFVAGTTPRAPQWMSRVGLEWLFRLRREPSRLWRRYLVRDPQFLFVLGRALRDRYLP
ncbi:MAG TPA: WecB/TagA/CpsF family glycosyltransferase [Polyangiaceae bacterium]|nr:WecB/TagA/CpsF family glycosyltransferase [Polyangiaceae bacterium]